MFVHLDLAIEIPLLAATIFFGKAVELLWTSTQIWNSEK